MVAEFRVIVQTFCGQKTLNLHRASPRNLWIVSFADSPLPDVGNIEGLFSEGQQTY
jgi:hypothetical protein